MKLQLLYKLVSTERLVIINWFTFSRVALSFNNWWLRKHQQTLDAGSGQPMGGNFRLWFKNLEWPLMASTQLRR